MHGVFVGFTLLLHSDNVIHYLSDLSDTQHANEGLRFLLILNSRSSTALP